MLETYKVLGSILALKEFTIKSLAEYSGVNADTVDTTMRRNREFWELIGKERTKKRGGQLRRFRVKPDAVESLRSKLKEHFTLIKTLNEPKEEETTGVETALKVPQKPPDPPVSLAAGEEALLYLFARAKSPEEKQTILEAAGSDLRSGRHEVERLARKAPDKRGVEAAEAMLQRVAALKKLSEAELASERGLPLQGELKSQNVLTRLFESLQYLIKTGDSERASALTKRMGRFVEIISPPPPVPANAHASSSR